MCSTLLKLIPRLISNSRLVNQLSVSAYHLQKSKIMSEQVPIEEQIKLQGDLVRCLKSQKADKEKVSRYFFCYILLSFFKYSKNCLFWKFVA